MSASVPFGTGRAQEKTSGPRFPRGPIKLCRDRTPQPYDGPVSASRVAHFLSGAHVFWRVVSALVKSAVVMGLLISINPVANWAAAQLTFLATVAASISRLTGISQRDAVLLLAALALCHAFEFGKALWDLASAGERDAKLLPPARAGGTLQRRRAEA